MKLFFIILSANLFSISFAIFSFIIATVIVKKQKQKAINQFFKKGE